MRGLLTKYAGKLAAAGLCSAGEPVLGGLDADLEWNREAPECEVLGPLFSLLNISSVAFAPPAEPYRTILDFLAREALAECPENPVVAPRDCETRTFLHDLPVCPDFDPQTLAWGLRRRKGVIVPGRGVVAFGTVSPEQAFVTVSSVMFAGFVKFFTDYLEKYRAGRVEPEREAAFTRVLSLLDAPRSDIPELLRGPFASPDRVLAAMDQAGKAVVDYRLVDSYFGNLSCLLDGVLYISQSGSSLDELPGAVDPCPLDGSSCAGMTASSEFTAHRRALEETGMRIVLHGHPKFTVILSMDCREPHCPERGACHLRCPRERFLGDVPVVPGEVGSGPFGLCNTLPPALRGRRGAVVYGHGLFCLGDTDFNDPFRHLLDVENLCRNMYLERVGRGSDPC